MRNNVSLLIAYHIVVDRHINQYFDQLLCIQYDVNLWLKTTYKFFRLVIEFLENLKYLIWPSVPEFVELRPTALTRPVSQKVELFHFVSVILI